MPENIEDILKNECGLSKDRPIVVGVSGGPDSLCLMETMRKAGYPVIVAYFDHQLRPESAFDASMVEKTANRLMLACYVDGADVRAYAEKHKQSIEEAARNLRYRFLFKLARQYNAQAHGRLSGRNRIHALFTRQRHHRIEGNVLPFRCPIL